MMTRRILRHEVPIDGEPHTLLVQGDPVHVDTRRIGVGPDAPYRVDFWVEGTLSVPNLVSGPETARTFQVFGTGHELPDDARYWGTAPRTDTGLVWHLFEVAP